MSSSSVVPQTSHNHRGSVRSGSGAAAGGGSGGATTTGAGSGGFIRPPQRTQTTAAIALPSAQCGQGTEATTTWPAAPGSRRNDSPLDAEPSRTIVVGVQKSG